ncbi:MAG: insulinase family protein [Eubacteriales bacterium]|nr:insulinase family protein [Eubacteriales bacterium]
MSFNVENRMEELKKSDIKNYDVAEMTCLEDLNSVGLILVHKKSGARVVVISNDDDNKVFSIGFKTPPFNDTGLQHILEHSTLCGSRKYPVKDPFVELCKGSLNTFLNAMTYPDKTVYPVASCNDADFKNIMDVYMDAVFYPDIYKHPEIFKQEGWHYELENVDGELKYNGVVFNEMKGVYSSPDDVLSRYTFVELFPDTAYRFESGGDPEKIPALTYEEFLKYHKEYYHPSNSYIYLYGNMNVEERLNYLDECYLSDFEKNDINIDSHIEIQKPFEEPKYMVKEYPVTDDESLENNTFLSYNVVVGTSLDAKLYLAMQILDYALVLSPGAVLKQALMDVGISTDVYSSFETSVCQPVYSIIAKNANEEQRELFVKTIEDVLSDIVKNGFNERTIKAGINYYEFKYRESDYGAYPKGLMYYLTMMDSWLYDDTKPFIHVEASETFEQIKKEAEEGLFENLVRDYILNNNHEVVISLVPKHGLLEEMEERETRKLAEYKNSLSREELEQLVKDTKALKDYQDKPSSQEDLEKIPMLKLSDIRREPRKLYNDLKDIDGIKVVHHNLFTNKIAYLMLTFNCMNVPDELLGYIGLLSSTLGLMDTEKYTYPEFTNEIYMNCGGLTTDAAVYRDKVDIHKDSILYELRGKVLFDKIPFILDMIDEMVYHTKFRNYKRLKEIISRSRSRLEAYMMNSGHSLAMNYASAQFSSAAYYSDLMRGYRFYELVQKLDSNFDELKEDIAEKLETLVKLIFTRDNLIVSITTDDEGYDKFAEAFVSFEGKVNDEHRKPEERHFEIENVKTAFTSSSQVQYVARCGNFAGDGMSYTGALKVLKVIFSYDYLWNNVRVKGGAYGCMSGATRNGDFYMVSYRDPKLRETNLIYEEAADYIEKFSVSDRDMVKFIIGTIGEIDTPLTPSAEGIRSFTHYFCNTSYEMLKEDRLEVLDADVESIRALAPLVRTAVDQNYLVVVGNQKEIESNREMFDVIRPLYIGDDKE